MALLCEDEMRGRPLCHFTWREGNATFTYPRESATPRFSLVRGEKSWMAGLVVDVVHISIVRADLWLYYVKTKCEVILCVTSLGEREMPRLLLPGNQGPHASV